MLAQTRLEFVAQREMATSAGDDFTAIIRGKEVGVS
jgi:hypothetical protein